MAEGRLSRPVWQRGPCRSCNVCLRGCPAEIVPEYRQEKESLRGGLYQGPLKGKPPEGKVSLPACQAACPIRQDTRGYVALIGQGKFREALELIREVNPLPAVCGFICHHPCEEACLREVVDAPVPMRLLKRFVAEYETEAGAGLRTPASRRRERVLVVGSGPAGLAAANDLALMGYGVTVREAFSVPGGMLAVGIPAYRLPRNILEAEIDGIRRLGVEIRTSAPFTFGAKGKAHEKLGFQAAFLAVGCHGSARLGVPGEALENVYPGVAFLREVNLNGSLRVGKSVAVIGGGNVAIDAARSALRLGAESVEIYYRRSREEMPAMAEEVEDALREGVRIEFLSAPVKFTARGKKAVGMECVRMELGEPDETGRRRPVPVERAGFRVRADTIITAVGQTIDRKALRGVELHPDGTVKVDPETLETSRKGVFSGGDVVTGPGWAIDAIGAGKKAAASIDRYLR
jgi:heterodisulfide reductase subunit A2